MSDRFPMPTQDELALVGMSMLNMVGTCLTLGHRSPGHTLDYLDLTTRQPFWIEVVHDYTAWTSRRQRVNCDAAQERLSMYVRESGWQVAQMNAMFPPADAS